MEDSILKSDRKYEVAFPPEPLELLLPTGGRAQLLELTGLIAMVSEASRARFLEQERDLALVARLCDRPDGSLGVELRVPGLASLIERVRAVRAEFPEKFRAADV